MVSKNNSNQNSIRLSIQISLNGLSFSVYNKRTQLFEVLKSYDFEEKSSNPSKLLEQVKKVFESETLLHQDYDECIVLHDNNWSTLVPQDLFDVQYLKEYLQYSIQVLNTDYITTDSLKKYEARNVYIPFGLVNDFIYKNFGEFEFHHLSTVFLNTIHSKYVTEEAEVFVNVSKGQFHLSILEDRKIVLSNHFEYQTKEDFVYYILFTLEQLNLDTSSVKVRLFGEITQHSDNSILLSKYIQHLSIYSIETSKSFEKIQDQASQFFTLLYLNDENHIW